MNKILINSKEQNLDSLTLEPRAETEMIDSNLSTEAGLADIKAMDTDEKLPPYSTINVLSVRDGKGF